MRENPNTLTFRDQSEDYNQGRYFVIGYGEQYGVMSRATGQVVLGPVPHSHAIDVCAVLNEPVDPPDTGYQYVGENAVNKLIEAVRDTFTPEDVLLTAALDATSDDPKYCDAGTVIGEWHGIPVIDIESVTLDPRN